MGHNLRKGEEIMSRYFVFVAIVLLVSGCLDQLTFQSKPKEIVIPMGDRKAAQKSDRKLAADPKVFQKDSKRSSSSRPHKLHLPSYEVETKTN